MLCGASAMEPPAARRAISASNANPRNSNGRYSSSTNDIRSMSANGGPPSRSRSIGRGHQRGSSATTSRLTSPEPTGALPLAEPNTIYFYLLFALAFALVFVLEHHYSSRSLNDSAPASRFTTRQGQHVNLTADTPDLYSMKSLVRTHQALVDRTHEVNQLLEDVNNRDAKISFLTREVQDRDRVLDAYNILVNSLKSEGALPPSEAAARTRDLLRAARLMNMSLATDSESDLLSAVISYASDSVRAAQVESVIRVAPDDFISAAQHGFSSNHTADESDADEIHSNQKLVDSHENVYIMSQSGDTSRQTIDTRLLFDLGVVIVAAALGGLLATTCHQPPLLGYLLGGSAVGPGGLKLIGELVQVETLAQFGATFLLFALGVEFNASKLAPIKYIATFGGAIQMMTCIVVTALLGTWLFADQLSYTSAGYIGATLGMSSTTVVMKSLGEKKQLESIAGQIMLALLVAQDLALSLILSLITLLAADYSTGQTSFSSELMSLAMRFAAMLVVLAVCALIWPIALRQFDRAHSHDLFLLGLVALCVFLTEVTERLIHSAAVGAFLAGLLISSSPYANQQLIDRVLIQFEPVRDMFAALFFASIGMLINPAFLLQHSASICALVTVTLVFKTALISSISRVFGYDWSTSLRTGLGLSQIGEFAFVLSNEGLSKHLINKDTYLLLLGSTAVSLFITPFGLDLSYYLTRKYMSPPPEDSADDWYDADGKRSDMDDDENRLDDEDGTESNGHQHSPHMSKKQLHRRLSSIDSEADMESPSGSAAFTPRSAGIPSSHNTPNGQHQHHHQQHAQTPPANAYATAARQRPAVATTTHRYASTATSPSKSADAVIDFV